MSVYFKGLQNIGGYNRYNIIDPTKDDVRQERLVLQLNNKGGNKDLDNFKDLLKAFPNKKQPDFLDLSFFPAENGNYDIYLNSKLFYKFSKFSDDYKMETETLEQNKWKNFNKILGILERISKGEEKFPLSKSYLKSKKCYNTFSEDLEYKSKDSFNEFVNLAHGAQYTSGIASDMLTGLKTNIIDYLTNIKSFVPGVQKFAGCRLKNSTGNVLRLIVTLPDEDLKNYENVLKNYKNILQPNVLQIERVYRKKDNKVLFYINDKELKVNKTNLPILAKLSDLTTTITKSKKEMPFPDSHLTDDEKAEILTIDDIDELSQLVNLSDAEKKKSDINFEMIDTDDDAKKSAGLISKSINQKMASFLNL